MKKWVLVAVMMVLVTFTSGNGVMQQADAMPPTPTDTGFRV